jgi:eukaryotic-like serine/threonine-protein kinase
VRAGTTLALPAGPGPDLADLDVDFGRYVVQFLIGEGAMARVYRAWDPLADRGVAIKVLKRETVDGRDSRGRRRFLREAEAAGMLSHPHIVTIFDVTPDYIVMELLEGISLEERMRSRPEIPLGEALGLLHPLCDALDYAHGRGVIHRDLKPANVVVLASGPPKLTDFGVAHLTSRAMTASGELLGSPAYMPPEQIDGLPISPASDVFSLASVFYEMVTGARAFPGLSVPETAHAVLFRTPALPSTLRPALPAHFDAVL